MPGTRTELAAWLDLAPLRDIPAEARGVFVINFTDLVHAEAADLLAAAEAAAAPPARAAGARSAWSSRAAWAASGAPPWAAPGAATGGASAESRAGRLTIASPVAEAFISIAHGILSSVAQCRVHLAATNAFALWRRDG